MRGMRFTPAACYGVVAGVAGGLSLAEACASSDLREPTVKGWLARGRKEAEGAYADFARAVDEARSARKMPSQDELDELTEAEARLLLTRLARKGNVQAIKLFLDRFLVPAAAEAPAGEAAVLLAEMDELAAKRRKHGS